MQRIFFSLCIIVFLFSCASENDSQEQIQQPPESNFYALTVGNSWVYKNFMYNSNTLEYDDTGIIDEVNVIDTETIDGEVYFKFKVVTTGNDTGNVIFNENGEQFLFYREVSGDLINDNGDIIYSNNNYQERLVSEESWGSIYDILTNNIEEVEVNAGLFSCLDTERYAKSPDGTQVYNGLDHYYYSDGIGLISYSISYILSSNPPIGMKHLESYNVQ